MSEQTVKRPSRLSLWFQRTMNTRTVTRIRRKSGTSMGMDLLVLHTLGRRSGEARETPLSWFADGDSAWLVVASGGGKGADPDWYRNLVAHPDRAAVEFHGGQPQPVVPQVLDGADRDRAWEQVVAAQPRYAKYQGKDGHRYPLIRLAKI
jgi:deazaflavin-dependent oxidoreductase (nitroreductase family)